MLRKLALMSALVVAGGATSESATLPRVALLPLVVAPAMTDYTVVPKASELAALTTQVRTGLTSPPRTFTLAPVPRHDSGACADVECARSIARGTGARIVVFGTVEREAGIRWTTRLSAVEVASGKPIDSLTYGVLGDYESLLRGADELGRCMARSIAGRPHCKKNPPAI